MNDHANGRGGGRRDQMQSVDYSTLEADVAEWMKGHIERVKEYCGEGEA